MVSDIFSTHWQKSENDSGVSGSNENDSDGLGTGSQLIKNGYTGSLTQSHGIKISRSIPWSWVPR